MHENDLVSGLERLADRGDVRGADEVLAGASAPHRSRRPAYVLVAAAVAAVLAVGANIVWFAGDSDDAPDEIVAASGIAEVPVTSAIVRAPILARDVYVALDGESRPVSSSDGGATWSLVSLPGSSDELPATAIGTAEDGALMIVGDPAPSTAASGSLVPSRRAWRSDDGVTWTETPDVGFVAASIRCDGTIDAEGVSYRVSACTQLLEDGEVIATAPEGRRLLAPLPFDAISFVVPVVDGDGVIVSLLTLAD